MEQVRYLELHGKHAEGEYATALIDAEVYSQVSRHRWYFDFKRVRELDGGKHGYVVTRLEVEAGRLVRRALHWMVLGIDALPEGKVVDHINGDPLDNRRSNLRLATHAESALNRRAARGRSGYRGVRRVGQKGRGRFVAVLKLHGHRVELGSYRHAREAARTWDLFALVVGGEAVVSHTNFPAQQYTGRVAVLREMLMLSRQLGHPMG